MSSPYSRPGSANGNWRDGRTMHPLYDTYLSIIARCERATDAAYDRYGGRGITVCTRWREDFWAFANDMGPRLDGTSIDRVDNDGPYSPDNCRWATAAEQNSNKRPYRRATHCRKGHKFSPRNTRVRPNGKRVCRACNAAWARNRRAQQRKESLT